MKKILMILLGVAATGALQAQCSVTVGADALFWRPCAPAFRYAIREKVSGLNTRSNIRTVDAEYNWGYRLRAAYQSDCDTQLQIDYLYFQPQDNKSVLESGAVLRGPLNVAGYSRLSASDRYTFQEANLKGRRAVWSGRCATLYGAVGVRWLDVKNQGRVEGVIGQGANIGRTDAKLWGVGAVVQAGLGYRIFSCIHLVGELGLSGLAGQRSLFTRASNPVTGAAAVINYGEETVCFPGLENRIVFKYSRQCGCFDLAGHIGWDQQYYIGAMKFGSLFTATPDAAAETVGMSGLVLGFSAGY